MNATSPILRPGKQLGGYRIDDVVGIGGMAVVYRARQLSLGRPVAMKILGAQFTNDTTFRERFRREATHAASLEHPNIVPVYDSGEADGQLYIAMRLIEGGTLADRMLGDGLSPSAAVEILGQIASALDAAHSVGLVHRDVKPQNILLTRGGHPYLADFGVAKGSELHGLTATGGFVGSINYASPEQIRGEPLTASSDIYSLTALAYQCVTGQVPYPRETDAGVMHAHLNEPPPQLPEPDHPAGRSLQDAIARGMAKPPGERFATSTTLIAAFEAAYAGLPSGTRDRPTRFSSEPRAPTHAPEPRAPAPKPAARASKATTAEKRRPTSPRPRPASRKPDRGRRASSGGPATIAGATVFAIVAVAVGFALAPTDDGPQLGRVASARIAVGFGAPWVVPDAPVHAIAGVRMTDVRSLSTTGTAGRASSAQIGMLRPASALRGGAPPGLAAAAAARPVRTRVSIGALPAARYDAALRGGDRLVRVYVVATESGDLAIACEVPKAVASATKLCDGIAGQLQLRGTKALTPGPDPALGRRLATILGTVTNGRATGDLDARDLGVRARRARAMSAVARKAAGELGALHPAAAEVPAVRRARRALADEAPALMRLARVTGSRGRTRYNAERERILRLERSLRRALQDLARQGYRIGVRA